MLRATLERMNSSRRNPLNLLAVILCCFSALAGDHPSKSSHDGLVLIRGGTIDMGINTDEIPRFQKVFDIHNTQLFQDEIPKHSVTLDDFFLDKFLVTNRQFKRFIDANVEWQRDRIRPEIDNGNYLKHWASPETFNSHANDPVVNVNWYAAVAYCRWLGKRLPTEAEWEYSCRAGSTARFSFGEDRNATQLGEYAWYKENAGGQPHPVGLRKPNVWGLYDMHGNVWEWVQDWHRLYLTDPLSAAPGLDRVNRGGSWVFDASFCRSATRGHVTPGHRAYDLGFRLLRAVQ